MSGQFGLLRFRESICEIFAKGFVKMRKVLVIAIVLLVMILGFAGDVRAEKFIELRIPCVKNSQVTAKLPSGEIINLGEVAQIPVKENYPAYTASKWAAKSSVCASAVNAIHMLVSVKDSRGSIISIVPSVTVAPAARAGAYFAIKSEAGTGIFGGFAPLVGSRVTIMNPENNSERELDGVPDEGEILVIRTDLPNEPEVFMVEIENRPAGRVITWGDSGVKIVARVIRPIGGVGRFGGTVFQERGRIRASHSGVIDVATSRRGEVGGLQIMPLKHALTSPEMISAWSLTQWLIIAPEFDHEDLEGQEPLFKKSLLPGTQLDDKFKFENFWNAYGRKPLVIGRRSGGDWEKLPEVSGRVDDALRDITHLRLYFPMWNEPLK